MSSITKNESPKEARTIPPDTETSRTIIVRLSVVTHKKLRVRVAEEDTSIQKWVESLVERELAAGEGPASKRHLAEKAAARS